MDLAETTKNEIVRRLQEIGWRVQAESAHAFVVHPLGLQVNCAVDGHGDFESTKCILVTCRVASDLHRAIEDHCVGYGETELEIVRVAADYWVTHTFSVLHAYLSPDDSEENQDVVELGTCVLEYGRIRPRVTLSLFLWQGFTAPTETLGDWRSGPTVDRLEILSRLAKSLSGMLLDRRVHWVKCFVGRMPGQQPVADCRFDNEAWAAGTAELRDYASSWSDVPFFRSQKQFWLFKPAARLRRGETLLDEMRLISKRQAHSTTAWWKIWHRRQRRYCVIAVPALSRPRTGSSAR